MAERPVPEPSLDRFRGNHGTIINPHRAIATLPFTGADIAVAIVMGIGLSAVFVMSWEWIGRAWGWAFRELAAPLGFAGGVSVRAVHLGSLVRLDLPFFNATAAPPTSVVWWITLVASAIVVLVSFVFRDGYLPLAYAVRLAAAVQGTALLFFRFSPVPFPYDLAGYVTSMMLAGATVIALIPLLLGLVYYTIDVTLLQKLGLTLAIAAHLLAFIPLQYAVQSYVIVHGSLLFLPLSFMLFGLLPQIAIFIAFYGWGMSWRAREPRGRRE